MHFLQQHTSRDVLILGHHHGKVRCWPVNGHARPQLPPHDSDDILCSSVSNTGPSALIAES
eukprot:1911502-Amphidinium_carterae.1